MTLEPGSNDNISIKYLSNDYEYIIQHTTEVSATVYEVLHNTQVCNKHKAISVNM